MVCLFIKNKEKSNTDKRDSAALFPRSVVRPLLPLTVVTHLRHLMFRRVTASGVRNIISMFFVY